MDGLEVGIDIGGTKTHLRFRQAGEARDLIVPTNDWRVRDWDKDAAALLALVHRFTGAAQIGALAVGAHGCDSQAECTTFQEAIAAHVSFPVQVVNDAELLPAALGLRHQIGLVAGTGSIAVSRSLTSGMLVAGGWGWVIGDEGSAAGLVREAGRAVSLHVDSGGSLDEPLVRLLLKALPARNPARIGRAISAEGSATALGRHAHILFAAEKEGSLLAQKVITEGARHLVDLVERLKRNGSEATTVVAGGGVIVAQPSLAAEFLAEVTRRFAGKLNARIYDGAPVEGACLLAHELSADQPESKAGPTLSSSSLTK